MDAWTFYFWTRMAVRSELLCVADPVKNRE